MVCERGTLLLDIGNNVLRIYSSQNNTWEEEIIKEERNEMYLKEIKHFIDCIRRDVDPPVSATDGLKTVELIEKAYKKANRSQKYACEG